MVDVTHFRGFRGEQRAGQPVPAGARPALLADEPQSTARAGHFSNAQIAALFAILVAIASIPVLLYPWPPLGDYINHLARMHVIATVRSDPDLARFYQVDWQVIPNLMMDLIVPVLQRVMNVYLAGQTYTIMCFVVILSGTMALNRQLYGRWSVLPLIAFPLLYNSVFLVGTMNYLFGIGLSLWALAAWAALRERAMPLRLAISTLFVLALFFCHLFSVGVYALDCNEVDPSDQGLYSAQVSFGSRYANLADAYKAWGADSAKWAIAQTDGKANVLSFENSEYNILKFYQQGFDAQIKTCSGCKLTVVKPGQDFANFVWSMLFVGRTSDPAPEQNRFTSPACKCWRS